MDRLAINLTWLLALRWGAVGGQLAMILLAKWMMDVPLPLTPLLAIIALAATSNAGAVWWFQGGRPVPEWTPGALMLLDVLLLTALLYFSGGPYNPFSFLYLVNIALAAVVLGGMWPWLLVGVSLACFGFLFVDHVSLPVIHDHGAGDHLGLHLQGMWVAFGVAAGFIVYFVQRVTRALEARDAELAAARSLTARHEKLASLATLAAGAAHQLATPLSTIAVISKELERHLQRDQGNGDAIGDARLIREQVERCRDILQQMAADAGESTGEAIVPITPKELLDVTLQGMASRERVHVQLGSGAAALTMVMPVRSMAQALRALTKNALEASGSSPVEIRVAARGATCQVEVHDRGSGMSSDVLAHAGEPFFTTKGPDRGMGLGLFLCRAVVEGIGGQLTLRSVPQQGTTATVVLPLSAGEVSRVRIGCGMAEERVRAERAGDGPSILVVDDDRVLRERLAKALAERGYDVRTAADYDTALTVAREEPPELAVVDLRMPGGDGIELVRALKQLDGTTSIVVLTGYGSIATALEAVRRGATHYLQKPADADEILAALGREGSGEASGARDDYLTPSLARAEWEHINRVLADCDGNISAAARRLGIHRRSLQRKLQKRPPVE